MEKLNSMKFTTHNIKITRGHMPAIPSNKDSYLTDEQSNMVNKMENFGWNLWFIRRTPFQECICMLFNASNGESVVVNNDGTLNYNHNIRLR